MMGKQRVFTFLAISLLLALIQPAFSQQAVPPVAADDSVPTFAVTRTQTGGSPRLSVTAKPRSADLYLDGNYLGSGALNDYGVSAGVHTLLLRAPGYSDLTGRVTVPPETTVSVTASLRKAEGYLVVRALPQDAEVTITAAGNTPAAFATEAQAVPPSAPGPANGGTHQFLLPAGTYSVTTTAFGYAPAVQTVDVQDKHTVAVSATLSARPLHIEALTVTPSTFNPADPGRLGTTTIAFSVSAPGRGGWSVTAADGSVVRDGVIGPFAQSNQRVDWNGRTADGQPLEPGRYVISVTVTDSTGRQERDQTEVVLTASERTVGHNLYSGLSGLFYLPLPDTLPAGSYQVGSVFGAWRTDIYGPALLRIPMAVGARIGLPGSVEMSATFRADLTDQSDKSRVAGTLSAHYMAFHTDGTYSLRGAPAVSVTAQTKTDQGFSGPDTAASFPGVSLLFSLDWGGNLVRLGVTPEFHVGPTYPVYFETEPAAIWKYWLYWRGGIYVNHGAFSGGVSAVLRTEPNTVASPAYPLGLAGEFHWVVPRTYLLLSAVMSLEWHGGTHFTPLPFVGISFLY